LKARGGGKIIMMGSGMGHRGAKGNSSYAVAKAGMWMLTRVAAQELAEHNIAVNEISPGPVRTELTRGIEERARATGGETAFSNSVEWIKQPEDVAPLAVFLASMPEPGPSAQSFCLNRRDI
jgi:3-oxoacyl-[acyl-carrier protein] reductase